MKKLTIKVTLQEHMLGTASADTKIHEKFIASKAPDAPSMEEEVAALGATKVIENAMTVFPKFEDGSPFIWDYMIRGFFKEACSMLKKVPTKLSSKLKAYKKEVDGLIFVEPRKIPIELTGEMGTLQRPLRAQTMQGERITLANSETIPVGSNFTFDVICLVDDDAELVKEWLQYGLLHGIGQWRNSGCGRFTFEVLNEVDC